MSLICSSRSSELEMKRLCAFQSIRNNSEPPPPKNHFYLDPWGRWPCSRPVICFLVAVSCAEFRKSYFQQYRSYFLNFLNKISSFPIFFVFLMFSWPKQVRGKPTNDLNGCGRCAKLYGSWVPHQWEIGSKENRFALRKWARLSIQSSFHSGHVPVLILEVCKYSIKIISNF